MADPAAGELFPMTRLGFLCVLCLPAALLAGGQDGPNFSKAESHEIVDMLQDTQLTFVTKIASLSDKQYHFKPAEDRWSAAEIAEHLFLAENAFHTFVDGTLAEEADPEWAKKTEGQTEMITKMVPDRSQKVQAPDDLSPKGKMSRAELLQGLGKARGETIKRAADTSVPYKAHVSSNPIFGPVDAGHWLRFAALHMIRHTKQLDEVLADAKFPK